MTFKDYRKRNGLKQIELVELMNEYGVDISQPHLSLIENGKMDPTPEQAAWLAGVSAEEEALTYEEELILELVSIGTEAFPISRRMLTVRTNFTDRACRKIIERLRSKGYWIVGDGFGYYVTEDPEVFNRWAVGYTAYARTILRNEAAMRKRMMGK